MTRNIFSTVTLAGILFAGSHTAQANDIIDFLRAISAPRVQPYAPRQVGPPPSQLPYHQNIHQRSPYVSPHALSAADHYTNERLSRQRISYSSPFVRPQSPTTISFGRRSTGRIPTQYPQYPVTNHRLPAPPVPGSFDHLPHELGSFVTCPVPLAACVRVRDTCRIAPNAVPVVVAVRDPHLGRFKTCVEQLAYVEVHVPPCPVRRVRVSPCRTKIRLDYGRYAVDIVSRNGVISIDYDN